jgi:hypothetical protein
MTRCLQCQNLDLKTNPKHAAVGYGWCTNKPRYCFTSFCAPTCEQFKQATDEVIAKRIEYETKTSG